MSRLVQRQKRSRGQRSASTELPPEIEDLIAERLLEMEERLIDLEGRLLTKINAERAAREKSASEDQEEFHLFEQRLYQVEEGQTQLGGRVRWLETHDSGSRPPPPPKRTKR